MSGYYLRVVVLGLKYRCDISKLSINPCMACSYQGLQNICFPEQRIEFGEIPKIYKQGKMQEIGMENTVYHNFVQSLINHIFYILTL